MELDNYYGYPVCCQLYFYKTRMKDKNLILTQNQNKITSNGFIPCPKCADYLVENNLKIVSLINNRQCPHSFPKSYCYDINCCCFKPNSVLNKIKHILKESKAT